LVVRSPSGVRGLLIDFDYAADLELNEQIDGVSEKSSVASETSESVDEAATNENIVEETLEVDGDFEVRTVCQSILTLYAMALTILQGTPPFMAIEAMIPRDVKFVHGPVHDVESFLYIILFFCTFVRGPNQWRFEGSLPLYPSIPLSTWFSKETLKDIGYFKVGHLTMSETAILRKFDPYWSAFIPIARELLDAAFPHRPGYMCELTHDKVINILNRALPSLQDSGGGDSDGDDGGNGDGGSAEILGQKRSRSLAEDTPSLSHHKKGRQA